MKKIFNLIVLLVLIFLLVSCQATGTETETETKDNKTTTEIKINQNTENKTTLNENLIFDWIEVKSISINKNNYYPMISSATEEQRLTVNEFNDLKSTGTASGYSYKRVDVFESKQDAIKQYENEIGKFFFDSKGGNYCKYTITGYELTTYEVKLYESNYLEIKTIKYNSSNNNVTESINGFISSVFYIEFYDNTSNQNTTNTENGNLIFNWTEAKYIYTINTTSEPKISYVTTKQEITENEYDELWETKTSVYLSNNVNQFESKQDAIKQYENEIGHYYLDSEGDKYYKRTVTGYELTTYEVKLYESNYLEIKTIKYNSSNNNITESIVGTLLYGDSDYCSVISFYD